MAVRYVLSLLSCLSFVGLAQAQDCTAPVGGANMNLRDSDILLQSFPDGSKVTFVCNVGYQPARGTGGITCTAGIWSPVMLSCERKNCGSAGEVENGNIDYSMGTEFGDRITINCDTGYNLVGKRTNVCGNEGWLERLPFCEVVVCDPPDTVVDGTFSPQKEAYEFREVVEYTCQKDLTLSGARSLLCSEDGTFKPESPRCINVECVEPDIKNAEWIRGSRPPYRFHSSVTYQCLTGYKLVGADSLICEIDSNWSPALPKCEKTQTPTKPPTITTTTTTTTTTTKTGNNGSSIAKGVGGFAAALVLCVALYFGGRKLMEKKKGSGKDDHDIRAPKPDEEIALSDQKGLEQISADEHEAGPPLDSSTAMREKNNM